MTLARVPVKCDKSGGFQRWLLFRRCLSHPDDPRFISYYQVFAKSDTTLETMVQIAGQRWRIEECFKFAEEVRIVLQSHCEGTSLRGISRVSGLSYNTGVSLIRAASQKAQLVHNAEVQAIDTDAIAADEMWSFVEKNKSTACPKESVRTGISSLHSQQY